MLYHLGQRKLCYLKSESEEYVFIIRVFEQFPEAFEAMELVKVGYPMFSPLDDFQIFLIVIDNQKNL